MNYNKFKVIKEILIRAKKENFYYHEIQCENFKIAQEVAETLRKGIQDKINMYK